MKKTTIMTLLLGLLALVSCVPAVHAKEAPVAKEIIAYVSSSVDQTTVVVMATNALSVEAYSTTAIIFDTSPHPFLDQAENSHNGQRKWLLLDFRRPVSCQKNLYSHNYRNYTSSGIFLLIEQRSRNFDC